MSSVIFLLVATFSVLYVPLLDEIDSQACGKPDFHNTMLFRMICILCASVEARKSQTVTNLISLEPRTIKNLHYFLLILCFVLVCQKLIWTP